MRSVDRQNRVSIAPTLYFGVELNFYLSIKSNLTKNYAKYVCIYMLGFFTFLNKKKIIYVNTLIPHYFSKCPIF